MSCWREADFMLRLLRSTLWPQLPIPIILSHWKTIRYDLAERPRHRIPQIHALLS
jgi:hypothetical protein